MATDADLTATFEASLAAVDATSSRTDAAGFEATLEAAIEPPAVGAPLPYDGVSLADTAVTLGPTPAELRSATTGVTPAGIGIAEYGTVAVQSNPGGDEPISLYPERHVAVLRESDIVPGVSEALAWVGEELTAGQRSTVFTTGPSATADMGGLVQGVHGPRAVHVIVLTDR